MSKKMKLSDLKLDSFITNVDAEKSKTYAGGISGMRCSPTDSHTCPTRICPTTDNFTVAGSVVCCWSNTPDNCNSQGGYTNCEPCVTSDGTCYTTPGGCPG